MKLNKHFAFTVPKSMANATPAEIRALAEKLSKEMGDAFSGANEKESE